MVIPKYFADSKGWIDALLNEKEGAKFSYIGWKPEIKQQFLMS